MRIRKLHVESYGFLSGLRIENLSGGLVIVLGRNEAGKSTLFSLLSSLLYGFYPVKNFPYKSWHADVYPEFKAELSLEGGSGAHVSRKLMSAPAGSLDWNGSVQNLGNKSLPFAGHVGRGLYNAVYALTQANLRSLDDAQRAEIEDRLLLGLSSEILRPAREAVKKLEAEADALWRSTKRGNQRYRLLEEARREAGKKREEAREADKAVREKADRLDEMRRRMETLLQEKAESGADIRRADELLPLKKRLEQIEQWRAQISSREAVDSLPEGIDSLHERLQAGLDEARENISELKADRARLLEKQKIFTPGDRNVLERAGDIDRWVRKIAAHESEQSSLAELSRKEERIAAGIEEAAAALLREPWEEDFHGALASLVLPDLKAGIVEFQEKRREEDILSARSAAPGEMLAGRMFPAWGAVSAAAGGAALLLSGLLLSSEVIAAVAVFLLLAAAFSFHLRIRQAALEDRKKYDSAQSLELLRLAGEKREAARRAVAEALAGIPVAEALLRNPDQLLYQGVEKLHSLSAEHLKSRVLRLAQEKEWGVQQENLEDLLGGFGLERASPEGLAGLERRLAAAREHERSWKDASERLKQIDSALPGMELKTAEAGRALNEFWDALKKAAGGDLTGRGLLDKAGHLKRLAVRIRDAREELEREYPSLAELEAEIKRVEAGNSDAWSFDPVEVEKRRDRLQEIQRELEDLREEKGRLETEINSASGQVSAGEIEGELARIEEEMEETARRRDRLMLWACLLREADRRFREKHQPDVLRRAGDYLHTITGGLYKTITTVDRGDGADQLVVISAKGDIHPVEFPLSGGTLDQIFLAFRLAVIDRLDDGREALPMLMDEALVNWDDGRIQNLDAVLRQAAARRQIFFFTCHEWMAGRLSDIAGAPPVSL